MNKRLQPVHWLALACIAGGCIVKEGGRLMEGGGFAFDGSRKTGYMEIALMSCCSAFACVYNEKLLKFQSEIPPSLQNVAMYVLGGICTLMFTLVPSSWTGGEAAASGAAGAA